MKINKILFVITAIFFISINIKSQDYLSTFYVSPGISVSWGGDSNFFFGWKLSLGYFNSEQSYYNITFGGKHTINSGKGVSPLEYKYLELQSGSFLGYYPLSAGAGVGITFSDNDVYPRASLFGGALFFVNVDYTFTRKIFDLGGSISLPIPFKKEFRDLGPG